MMVAKSMIKVTVKIAVLPAAVRGGNNRLFQIQDGHPRRRTEQRGRRRNWTCERARGIDRAELVRESGSSGKVSDPVTLMVLNGKDLAIHITVDEETQSYLDSKENPEGHLKAELSNVRVCIVRPAKPADITITAASGANYWCP